MKNTDFTEPQFISETFLDIMIMYVNVKDKPFLPLYGDAWRD